MAVRIPVYNNSGNIQEMSPSAVTAIIDNITYQYALNPSVTLSVVGSGGNLSAINDTRYQAGTVSTSVSSFPDEATTQEPQLVTTSFQRINQTNAVITPTGDSGKTFPLFLNSGNLQAMNTQDVLDTFIRPAVDKLVSGTLSNTTGGTYFISTTTSVAGATLVSSTPIFIDTRADTSAYDPTTIGDHSLDNPTTITNFYLHRHTGAATAYTSPMFITASNQLQEYNQATFNSLMQEYIRDEASESTGGYKIRYSIGTTGTGNTRGSGITNTTLNGSGDYQTRQVNNDDYRAQEFPNGTPVTSATYYLRIFKTT